ncbi:MAG: response regulator transcription factor [Saprospiraceae bacterium]|nr:response regulator transcription factor [Saprospiraceae bacterium]
MKRNIPHSPSDDQLIADIRAGGRQRQATWKHIYQNWRSDLAGSVFEMGGTRKEADETLSKTMARVDRLAKANTIHLKADGFKGYLCRCVVDEALVSLLKKEEDSTDERAVAYIRKHWREKLTAPVSNALQTAEAVFTAGVERMRRRILNMEKIFELQEWHILKHLQDETLLAAVEMGGVWERLALTHIQTNLVGGIAHYVLNNKGTKQDAEDVCLIAASHFHNQLINKSGVFLEKTLEKYLYRIGQNEWGKMAEKRQRAIDTQNEWGGQIQREERTRLNHLEERNPPALHTPVDGASSMVEACAERLKDHLKTTYLLHLEGYSNKEIVDQLKLDEQTVKNHKVQAKDLVEKCMYAQKLAEPLKTIYLLHVDGMKDSEIAKKMKLEEQDVRTYREEAERRVCTQKLAEPLKTIYMLHLDGTKDSEIAQKLKLDEQAVRAYREEAEKHVKSCLVAAKKNKT